MSYNPKTDFICIGRRRSGDEAMLCYKDESHPTRPCCEDNELTGKTFMGTGCTPDDSIMTVRVEYIRENKDLINDNQKKLKGE
jgi:hypothetical protein